MSKFAVKQWVFSKWTIIMLGATALIPFLYFNCSPVRFATLPSDAPGQVHTEVSCDGKPNGFKWTVEKGTLTEPVQCIDGTIVNDVYKRLVEVKCDKGIARETGKVIKGDLISKGQCPTTNGDCGNRRHLEYWNEADGTSTTPGTCPNGGGSLQIVCEKYKQFLCNNKQVISLPGFLKECHATGSCNGSTPTPTPPGATPTPPGSTPTPTPTPTPCPTNWTYVSGTFGTSCTGGICIYNGCNTNGKNGSSYNFNGWTVQCPQGQPSLGTRTCNGSTPTPTPTPPGGTPTPTPTPWGPTPTPPGGGTPTPTPTPWGPTPTPTPSTPTCDMFDKEYYYLYEQFDNCAPCKANSSTWAAGITFCRRTTALSGGEWCPSGYRRDVTYDDRTQSHVPGSCTANPAVPGKDYAMRRVRCVNWNTVSYCPPAMNVGPKFAGDQGVPDIGGPDPRCANAPGFPYYVEFASNPEVGVERSCCLWPHPPFDNGGFDHTACVPLDGGGTGN